MIPVDDDFKCPGCGDDPVNGVDCSERACCEAIRRTMVTRHFVVFPEGTADNNGGWNYARRKRDGDIDVIWPQRVPWSAPEEVKAFIERWAGHLKPEIEVADECPYPDVVEDAAIHKERVAKGLIPPSPLPR